MYQISDQPICIREELQPLIPFPFCLIRCCRTRWAEWLSWVTAGGVLLGTDPLAGILASAAVAQRRHLGLAGSRDTASLAQRRPVALTSAASLGSPASSALACVSSHGTPTAAAQTEDGTTAGASMAAMAGNRTGDHVLDMRSVGFSNEVGLVDGGAWRQICFPCHLRAAAALQPGGGARGRRCSVSGGGEPGGGARAAKEKAVQGNRRRRYGCRGRASAGRG